MSLSPLRHSRALSAATTVPISSSFTWDDVIETGRAKYNSSDLTGFFEKINRCNRGSVSPTKSNGFRVSVPRRVRLTKES